MINDKLRNQSDWTERLAIYNYLKENNLLNPLGNGVVEYVAGWSDARVAEEVSKAVGRKLSPDSVRSIRRDTPGWGKLRTIAQITTSTVERIATLEARNKALEERVANLEKSTLELLTETNTKIDKLYELAKLSNLGRVSIVGGARK